MRRRDVLDKNHDGNINLDKTHQHAHVLSTISMMEDIYPPHRQVLSQPCERDVVQPCV